MNLKRKIIFVFLIFGTLVVISNTMYFTINDRNYTFFNNRSSFPDGNDCNNAKFKISAISPKIHIDNNWSDAKNAGICSGTGTQSDPYIIQNLEINAGNVGHCMLIQNSLEYFEIKDCTLTNPYGSGIFLGNIKNGKLSGNLIPLHTGSNTGIFMNNCSRITISLNEISGGDYGIQVTYSNSIEIIGNICESNEQYGIVLSYSVNNRVTQNEVSKSYRGVAIYSCNYTNVLENTVSHTLTGIEFYEESFNNFVSENKAYYSSYHGIYLSERVISNNITKNEVKHNNNGIVIEKNSSQNYISDNILENNTTGIWIRENSDNNYVIGNEATDCHNGIQVDDSNSNLISDNIINDHRGPCIKIHDCSDVIISNNSLIISLMSGIELYNTNNTNIEDNMIRDCVSDGIYTQYSSYNNISRNKITYCTNGIRIDFSSNHNDLINNSVSINEIGVKLYRSNYNLVIKDFITDNVEDIVEEECEGNIIKYSYDITIDLGFILMIIFIATILASLLLVSIIGIKIGTSIAGKRKRKKEKEKVLQLKTREKETKKEQEEEELISIPHLDRFIKQFIYKQFRNIEKQLPKISPSQVDDFFKTTLKEKVSLFYNAMDSLGYKLSLYQESLLFDKCFAESTHVRQDLVKLLERREAQHKIEEQRRATATAFGEEMTSEDLMEKMEKLKSVDEEIDELFKTYEKWEVEASKSLPSGAVKIEFPLPQEARKKKFTIFLSYSTLDSSYFQIPQIAKRLKQYREIDDVLFWEKDSGENIVEYMERALRKCNIFILFCTERALGSDAVKDEWQAAFQMRKKQMLKIIPVYEQEKNIPRLLWHLLNVKYTKDDFEGFIKNLFKEILRPL